MSDDDLVIPKPEKPIYCEKREFAASNGAVITRFEPRYNDGALMRDRDPKDPPQFIGAATRKVRIPGGKTMTVNAKFEIEAGSVEEAIDTYDAAADKAVQKAIQQAAKQGVGPVTVPAPNISTRPGQPMNRRQRRAMRGR